MAEKQVNTIYKKATQALNLLARKKGGRINKMKAIKLIFLADRLHLRKYGRPIVGDVYWAMKLGPVGSLTKNIAELNVVEDGLKYVKKFIQPTDERKQTFVSLSKEDLSVFSKTDLECIDAVYKQFSDLDQFELAEITHNYSEWTKHKKELYGGKKRVKMDYDDFFIDTHQGDDLFFRSKSDLKMAKESFIESKEVSEFFVK